MKPIEKETEEMRTFVSIWNQNNSNIVLVVRQTF